MMAFPNRENIRAALDCHFASIADEVYLPPGGSVYAIDNAFGSLATYWKDKVRASRFTYTEPAPAPQQHDDEARRIIKNSGTEYDNSMDRKPSLDDNKAQLAKQRLHVLYRANITDDLFELVEDSFESRLGTMVTGPQGIGKSHSLVNLVLKLQASGKYLVTFIPDCSQWCTIDFLLLAICGSFGIDPGPNGIGLDVPTQGSSWALDVDLDDIIEAISSELVANSKKWGFAFGEVSHLFSRDFGASQSKIRYLPYPFSLVQHVVKPGVTSVFSASWSDIGFFINNKGFRDFKHVTEMSDSELNALFLRVPDVALKGTLDPIKKLAGGVPQYVKKYLEVRDPVKFVDAIIKEIHPWLQKMMEDDWVWKMQLNSIICCVLGIKADPHSFYDMKYLIRRGDPGSPFYEPLFPAVVDAYRSHFVEEILQHVEDKGGFLRLSSARSTSPDGIGRLLQYSVIQRILKDGISLDLFLRGHGIKGCRFTIVDGSLLPVWPPEERGMWVPRDSHFPAINFFVKCKSLVVAFQVHVSQPKHAANTFFEMCKASDWFVPGRQVILVYLSPSVKAKKDAGKLVPPTLYPNAEGVSDCTSAATSIPEKSRKRGAGTKLLLSRTRPARRLPIAEAVGDRASTVVISQKTKREMTKGKLYIPHISVYTLTTADLGLEGLTLGYFPTIGRK
jgi:hypothetical protein